MCSAQFNKLYRKKMYQNKTYSIYQIFLLYPTVKYFTHIVSECKLCFLFTFLESNCVVLVRRDAGHSRWHNILRLEGTTVRPPSASVQEPDGPDDIVGCHGHADVRHVFCRLCIDI